MMNDAGTRHPDINYGFTLTDAMKRSGHKRIVLDGVSETDKLRASQTSLIARALGGVFDDPADLADGIHVDAGASGGGIYRRAKSLGGSQRFRNRIQKLCFRARRPFLDQRRIAADKVHSD